MNSKVFTTRKTTEFEKRVFQYLNDLRLSGETNMFGAGQYIERKFKISKRYASELLDSWMFNFSDIGDYDEIAV